MALRITFPEIKNATDTVFQVMSSGFSPAAMEFLDSNVIGVLNRDRELYMQEQPTLLMEFTGFSEEGLRAEMAYIEEICTENSSTFIDKGIGQTERDRLWEMRHLTFESIKRQNPVCCTFIVDIEVRFRPTGMSVASSSRKCAISGPLFSATPATATSTSLSWMYPRTAPDGPGLRMRIDAS